VQTEARNIFTNPPRNLFTKSVEYIKDEYGRKRELEYEAHQEHKKKLQEQPFKSASPGDKPFFSDKQTYFVDNKLASKTPQPEKSTTKFPHDQPFKPASPSKNALNKYPEYKSDPIKIALRKVEEPAQKKDPFKPTNTAEYVRPTPSISLNKQNLKFKKC